VYNIEEIKSQNQSDCWSMMYIFVASSIREVCGRDGEGAIREAIRRLGATVGETARKKIAEDRLATNIVSLFRYGFNPVPDPRFRTLVLKEEEQVRLWEVHTCPFADLWKEYGAKDIGHLYCEEFYHSSIRAFTKGKGQTNLSKSLTHKGDNHCRFSVYFRPANLDPVHRAESFPGECGEQNKADEPVLKPHGAEISLEEKWLFTYVYLMETATERFGAEGSCAVALGLRKLALEMAKVMRIHASATGKTADGEFLKHNFPIPLDVVNETFWKTGNRNAAKTLLDFNFIRIFREEMGL